MRNYILPGISGFITGAIFVLISRLILWFIPDLGSEINTLGVMAVGGMVFIVADVIVRISTALLSKN